MKLAVYIGKESKESEGRIAELFRKLKEGGMDLYELSHGESPSQGTDMLLSIGGDGTFLYASILGGSDSCLRTVLKMLLRLFFPENIRLKTELC